VKLQALLAVALLTMGCSDDGAGPGGLPLPLRAGTYVFDIGAPAAVCNDVTVPQSGTSAQALAIATQSGNEWLLRAASPVDGSFELRLRPGAPDGAFFIVTGTMSGQMIDNHQRLDGIPPSFRRAAFETVPILAHMAAAGGTIVGSFGGTVTFTRDGIISVCPPGQVSFSLEARIP
jgi:hypothetical protein